MADGGDRDGAMAMLAGNLEAFPYDRDTLIALAVYESQAGDIAAATAHAELLAELEPEDASIRDFLNQLRR
jgi:predicted TPR repeat methyltransferase